LQIYNQNRLSELISLNLYSNLTLLVNGLTHLKRKNVLMTVVGGHAAAFSVIVVVVVVAFPIFSDGAVPMVTGV
jgi:hypothetical protein